MKLLYKLGSGKEGYVYLADFQSQRVAVKVARQAHENESSDEDDDLSNQTYYYNFTLECEIQKNLTEKGVPNIVPVLCYNVTQVPHYIVMPFMEKGPLWKLFRAGFSNMLQRVNIMLDILRGLVGIHENKIVFCDLKSSNVLIDGNMKAYIGDFGHACEYNISQGYRSISISVDLGTNGYTAPEIYENQEKVYTKESDIFSLGVVYWEMFSYTEPFRYFRASEIERLTKQRDWETIPYDCPAPIKSIIRGCRQDADKRPSFQQISEALEKFKQVIVKPAIVEISPAPQPVPASPPKAINPSPSSVSISTSSNIFSAIKKTPTEPKRFYQVATDAFTGCRIS